LAVLDAVGSHERQLVHELERGVEAVCDSEHCLFLAMAFDDTLDREIELLAKYISVVRLELPLLLVLEGGLHSLDLVAEVLVVLFVY